MIESTKPRSVEESDQIVKKRNEAKIKMYRQISHKLLKIMTQKNMTQAQIIRQCQENHYPIAQSTVSKIIQYPDEGQYSITLGDFLQVCRALEINPSEVLDPQSDFDIDVQHEEIDTVNILRSPLVMKPTEDEFLGYCNLYHCYFFSTISSESHILYGELRFEESPLKDYCEAKFKLDTRKKDKDQQTIYKEYVGKLAISPRMSSCYCLLENKKIGEICFIVFRHLYLNNENLQCRLAVVATASAGDNRRPTIHRMIISRNKISEEKLKILKAQLRLNTSDIMISKANLERITQSEDRTLPDQVMKLFGHTIREEAYYRFSEFQIRNLDISLEEKLKAICLLRNESISPKYNKVGSKVDELMFDILTKSTDENSIEKP